MSRQYMSATSSRKRRKRCPNGTRRNRRTGLCEPTSVTTASPLRIALIVPFRDTTAGNTRTKQLDTFLRYMTAYMAGTTYKIFVIEQSADGRKFNRGKLLNIGFILAKQEQYDVFIFHDVDLLPSPELRQYYVAPVGAAAVHIAAVWGRYNKNPRYFGGITALNAAMFEKINGYPNNFWGWGGEDDELYLRIAPFYRIVKPTAGTIEDLENMDLNDKMNYLRQTKEKFMRKNEVLAEHAKTWKTNGLSNLGYKVIGRHRCMAGIGTTKCVRVVVDVGLNGEWTDDFAF